MAALVLATALPSEAQDVEDWYVSATGDDASDCLSPEKACRTLAAALARASAGSTVHVGAGVYAERTIIRTDVTVQGAGADVTVLGPVAIWQRALAATLADLSVAGGSATAGGGIENVGTLTLRRAVVRDNTVWASDGYQGFGAGIYNTGTLTILDSTVRDNRAAGFAGDERSGLGGGVHNRGSLTLVGSTISGNTAHVGAGIYNAGVATVRESTLSGNAAHFDGGAMATTATGRTTLAFATLTANTADSDANGIGDGGGFFGPGWTRSTASIVGGNSDPGREAPDCSGALESGGRNVVADPAGCALTGEPGTDVIEVDPRLGPLADNGGRTLTHALLPGSPALDAAGDEECSAADQRGVARPQGRACDAGAVELEVAVPVECPCSLWDDSAEPALVEDPDSRSVELGVRFRSDVDGFVTGVRFYKGPGNRGRHTGSLWSPQGTRLATGTFVAASASGWQQLTFRDPVAVEAGVTYVASYHAPRGRYSVDDEYFADGARHVGPLEALGDGDPGGNGVYSYGRSRFPTSTHRASNYWVDVTFVTTLPAPAATSPAAVR